MIKNKLERRKLKQTSIRKKISGAPEKPRMSVFRSLKQIYVQIIDDVNGKTLVAASSLSKEIEEEIKTAKSKVEISNAVGKLIGEKAKAAGIETVVFDRSGYRYHGRVKALADSARKTGLIF